MAFSGERDAHQSLGRRRQEQGAHRAVDRSVGHVEQLVIRGPRHKDRVELGTGVGVERRTRLEQSLQRRAGYLVLGC